MNIGKIANLEIFVSVHYKTLLEHVKHNEDILLRH